MSSAAKGFRLKPGDLLAVFSDGVTEATGDWREFLGDKYVNDMLCRHHHEPLVDLRERILKEVRDFSGADGMADDTTLMLLRRGGA